MVLNKDKKYDHLCVLITNWKRMEINLRDSCVKSIDWIELWIMTNQQKKIGRFASLWQKVIRHLRSIVNVYLPGGYR